MPRIDRPCSQERHTFLLSLWCEREGEPWRAALRPADGAPRIGFADVEQLAAYLLRLQDEYVAATAPAHDHGRRAEGQK